MAAAKMGYSEQRALTAGAVVQQYQNYANKNNPDAGNVGVMARNIVFATISGLGDNPDDPPQISAGHKPGSDCNTTPPSVTNPVNTSNGGGGEGPLGGLNRGWQGGTIFLSPGCYGHCGGVGYWVIGTIKPR
jgi:hypothetical protein